VSYPDPFGSSFHLQSTGKVLLPLTPDIVVSPTCPSETFGQWNCRIDVHAPVLACTTRRSLALLGPTIPPPDYLWGLTSFSSPASTGPASASGLRFHRRTCVVSACGNMAQSVQLAARGVSLTGGESAGRSPCTAPVTRTHRGMWYDLN